MKKPLFVIVFILLVSCKKETKNPYVGNWYFDKVVNYDSTKTHLPKQILEIEYGPYYNFNIINDSVFDFKNGFFRDQMNVDFMKQDSTKRSGRYYLGTKTLYKIINSKLLFFDKTNKKWDTIRIKKIAQDTMIVFGKENELFKLIRKKDYYFNDSNYDAITVDRSACFGNCPINSTYIDRDGNFFFKGFDHNTRNENLCAKIDSKKAKEIFDKFDKIDFSSICKRHKNYDVSDCQTNTITFFKNGKIVKTYESYFECPIDLDVAFTNLSYVYQKVNVTNDDKFILKNYVMLNYLSFQNENNRMYQSESFYLEVALHNGKRVTIDFNPKYELKFLDVFEKSNIKTITTDGRFYKVTKKDNSSFTIDIGYNFIDANPIIMKNRNY